MINYEVKNVLKTNDKLTTKEQVNDFLTMFGFAVAHVNYRGSLGFGQDSLESLPGHCGINDVNDCMEALNVIIKSGLINSNKIYCLGGSHGGFLTTHLISQYPSLFQAAAVRNPVVNIVANYLTCDIPDWCLSETGTGVRIGPNDGAPSIPSPSNENYLLKMFHSSPVSTIDKVNTPLLLLLGKNDVSFLVFFKKFSRFLQFLSVFLIKFSNHLFFFFRNVYQWDNHYNIIMVFNQKALNVKC